MLGFILYLSFSLSNLTQYSDLVTQSESNNNIYAVSNIKNDKGGTSFGLYQFNSTTYKKWLKTLPMNLQNSFKNIGYINTLKKANTIQLATIAYYQHLYSYNSYYKPIINSYNKILNKTEASPATKKLLYSLAIQHSPKGYKKILNNSDGTIEDIQQKRLDYVNNLNIDSKLKKAIKNRYKNELKKLNS